MMRGARIIAWLTVVTASSGCDQRSIDGDVTGVLFVQDTVPPDAVTDLTVTRDDNVAVLRWTAVGDDSTFDRASYQLAHHFDEELEPFQFWSISTIVDLPAWVSADSGSPLEWRFDTGEHVDNYFMIRAVDEDNISDFGNIVHVSVCALQWRESLFSCSGAEARVDWYNACGSSSVDVRVRAGGSPCFEGTVVGDSYAWTASDCSGLVEITITDGTTSETISATVTVDCGPR